MAETQFSVGGMDVSELSAAQKYRRLASMQATNQNRSRMLAGAVGNNADRRRRVMNGQPQPGDIPFTITNWHRGEGYFRGIAQDIVDDNEDYNDHLDRMG
jgi:hypothetical protein